MCGVLVCELFDLKHNDLAHQSHIINEVIKVQTPRPLLCACVNGTTGMQCIKDKRVEDESIGRGLKATLSDSVMASSPDETPTRFLHERTRCSPTERVWTRCSTKDGGFNPS
ncbi:hypothetical protein ElyMa_002988600 [Elysia marginata]|uniref:Uncharacterized protein n=1 Tax=Elysia marginata TaxID=1093978 RepID=A0AAV4IFW1_9GAST|nr:hypothetical protein ElyMa_002988600 [Elysia marginata]